MTTTTKTTNEIPAIVRQLRDARRVGTPLVGITTPDQRATIALVLAHLNGNDEQGRVIWDCHAGLTQAHPASKGIVADLIGGEGADFDPTIGNPAELLSRIRDRLPAKAIVFMLNAQRFVDDAMTAQGIANLRDVFKQDRRTLVLLGPSLSLPSELTGDVIVFDEPLPDADQLGAIIRDVHEAASLPLDAGAASLGVEAVQGLPAFVTEQVVAMSLTKAGLDVDSLWERKRKAIEQTPGLSVYRTAESFDEVGGVENVKDYVKRIMTGDDRPNAVVFVDEIEKMIAGAGTDTSGVSTDQLGTLLAYMEDQNAVGMIFVGPPGSAKSMVAKAAGDAGGVPTIKLDLGGAKGGLVGESEKKLRDALKVITSVSNGRSIWLATCNSIAELPPELRRRFKLGTFFFDLPTADERDAIWPIHLDRFGFAASEPRPNDESWTGAEIKQCCDIARRLGVGLRDAAQFIVPVARSAQAQLDELRKLANGRFLSASRPGVYETNPTAVPTTGRRIEIDD